MILLVYAIELLGLRALYRDRPSVGSEGRAFFYERGTPVVSGRSPGD